METDETMNTKQQKQITEIMQLRKVAYASILADSAKDMALLSAKESIGLVRNLSKQTNVSPKVTAESIAGEIHKQYMEALNKGGTYCVERVIQKQPNGTFKLTTESKFIPWLSDMATNDANNIIKLIGDAETEGVYPLDIAKQLDEYMQGTNHNAVTAARTECQKIRSDARFESFNKLDVQYGEYVTAGDDQVRPEHAMRDGKIYKMADFPELGEPNCRCTVVPADYKVANNGATVEDSQAEYLTEDQLHPAKGTVPAPRTVEAKKEAAPESKLSGMIIS